MIRMMGIVYAAIAALVIAMTPIPSAQASSLLAGPAAAIRDTVPGVTSEARYRGGRGYGRGYRRGFRAGRVYRGYGYYRPYRRVYRPAYYGYGPACFIRPAQWVWTPYGYRLRPARRICRY